MISVRNEIRDFIVYYKFGNGKMKNYDQYLIFYYVGVFEFLHLDNIKFNIL
jgi:hypothetical protein